MTKKYIVRMTDGERRVCDEVVGQFKVDDARTKLKRIYPKIKS